jgi:hypothetical protein
VLVVMGINLVWPEVRKIGALNDLHPIDAEPVAGASPLPM